MVETWYCTHISALYIGRQVGIRMLTAADDLILWSSSQVVHLFFIWNYKSVGVIYPILLCRIYWDRYAYGSFDVFSFKTDTFFNAAYDHLM